MNELRFFLHDCEEEIARMILYLENAIMARSAEIERGHVPSLEQGQVDKYRQEIFDAWRGLCERVAALEADRERLDYLEAQTMAMKAPNLRTWGGMFEVGFIHDPMNPHGLGRDLREAIDHAMRSPLSSDEKKGGRRHA